mmetsp:Transcript_72672/g.213165  ORF Transcript_72672/g.213165 Transcript_72672/m.213165 type:complete len:428 (+) Transcript_72672:939-2222(+)
MARRGALVRRLLGLAAHGVVVRDDGLRGALLLGLLVEADVELGEAEGRRPRRCQLEAHDVRSHVLLIGLASVLRAREDALAGAVGLREVTALLDLLVGAGEPHGVGDVGDLAQDGALRLRRLLRLLRLGLVLGQVDLHDLGDGRLRRRQVLVVREGPRLQRGPPLAGLLNHLLRQAHGHELGRARIQHACRSPRRRGRGREGRERQRRPGGAAAAEELDAVRGLERRLRAREARRGLGEHGLVPPVVPARAGRRRDSAVDHLRRQHAGELHRRVPEHGRVVLPHVEVLGEVRVPGLVATGALGALGDRALHVDHAAVHDLGLREAAIGRGGRVERDVAEAARPSVRLAHGHAVEDAAVAREVVPQLLRRRVARDAADEELGRAGRSHRACVGVHVGRDDRRGPRCNGRHFVEGGAGGKLSARCAVSF